MNKSTIKRVSINICLSQAKEQYVQMKSAQGIQIENFNTAYMLFLRDNNLTGDEEVEILNDDIIYKWVNIMKQRDLKPESINSYLSRIRTFIYYCIEKFNIKPFKIKLISHQEENVRYYTDDELRLLLKKPNNKCSFVEYRTWVICCFMLATGARAATVSNIHLEDIDFNTHYCKYRHLKNKKFAIVPLSPDITNILNEYLKTWDLHSEYLFCDVCENQLTTSAIRQAFNKYCESRNVQALSPHALRNSFARGWIKNGGGVFQLQQLLTHSDLTMTRRYVRLFSEDLKQDVNEYTPLDTLRKSTSRKQTVQRHF